VHTDEEGMGNPDDERKDTKEVEERERGRELEIYKYLSGKVSASGGTGKRKLKKDRKKRRTRKGA